MRTCQRKDTMNLSSVKLTFGPCVQLNQEALKEHDQKLRSLPAEVKEAVNVCVGGHFPELVDQDGNKKVEGEGFYGDVFLG